jgi:selenocysteine-specific elongation factor
VYVIGTAGHVDHGKSTLVQALTGINPDRLAEEQARSLTIDLGFAWLTLPSGREVSMVDVPGHEDFIRNMLAGIGGVDLGLLVVAADEAIMPQTREHLAILDLLQVPRGVVALTKCDLVPDPDWLELVQEEIREQLAGTVLAQAPIVAVSSVTRMGLDELLQVLDTELDLVPPHRDLGRPRLPIDRAFAISGFGTVVTGTLQDGSLRVGDTVAVLPPGMTARIRGLQSHKTKVDQALPGSRVAVNLTGVNTDELARGQVIALPGTMQPTTLADLRLRVLKNAPWPIRHNQQVEFFAGAARTPARLRLLDAPELLPGQYGWVQANLEQPLVLARGDRVIVRLLSPSTTLGGGLVVQPYPRRRHKRFSPAVLAELEALASDDPLVVVLALVEAASEGSSTDDLLRLSGLPRATLERTLHHLVAQGALFDLVNEAPGDEVAQASSLFLGTKVWESWLARLRDALQGYHREHPMRLGMPREELRSRLRLADRPFDLLITQAVARRSLLFGGALLSLPDHAVALSPEQNRLAVELVAELRATGATPPSASQAEERLGAELLQYLIDVGQLVKASDSVLFDAHTVGQMTEQVVAFAREHGQITVAECRDLLQSSRRYAMSLLEHLDRLQITKRVGDTRVLRRAADTSAPGRP